MNLWIPCLILMPNLLRILAPPIKAGEMAPVPRKFFSMAENVGRIGVLLLPLFSAVRLVSA
ncbi:hypothetical protein [Paenibacillus sp. 1P07SE]|uniref:hypothetical protein n=1 Tax=Paenibacillus sp. 1P07SE TaxID=3132209 RepID=UPI0039A6F33B